MMIPSKKLNSGFEIPVLGLGTYSMGGGIARDQANDDQRDITAIETAINLGIKHIDTAELYAEGYAEVLVGQAIKDFDRSKLFLASKVQKTHLNSKDIKIAVKDSLKRLGTDYFD